MSRSPEDDGPGAPAAHRCPRDAQPLEKDPSLGGRAGICPECEGLWLDRDEVERLLPGLPGVAEEPPRRAPWGPHAVRPCPACGRGSLLPRHGAARRLRFGIHVCDRCGGTWLDLRRLRAAGKALPGDALPEGGEEPPETTTRPSGEAEPAASEATGSEAGTLLPSFPGRPREWFVALTGIPLELGRPCRVVPVVTLGVALACVAVYLWQLAEPGLVPALGLAPQGLRAGEWHRLFTGLFLHAGIAHLAVNLFFLITFGDNLEERHGALPYLGLYIAAGAAGGLASCVEGGDLASRVPRIGASGAISGLLGAYLVAFPRTRILMGIPFVRFVPLVLRWPVWAFLAVWVTLNVTGWHAQRASGVYGVDYVAHLAGFGTGLLGGILLGREGTRQGTAGPRQRTGVAGKASGSS